MEPINFKQSSKTLLKPENMTDEECSSLHIYNDGEYCISCWRPSLRERLSMLLFGKVWLWVLSGNTRPPVSIEGSQTIFKEQKGNG